MTDSTSSTSSALPAKVGPYRTLDAWRGLAALAVVFFHWGEMVVYGNAAMAGNPLYAACSFGYLGVQIFFVISGYVIASTAMATVRRSDSPWSFMKARLRRIYPTYWAGLALTIGFYYAGYVLVQHGIMRPNVYTQYDPLTGSPISYLANASLTMHWLGQYDMLAVAWTLSYEMGFYLIFALFLGLLGIFCQARHLLAALNILTIVCLVWLIAAPYSCPFPFNMWPQFGLGVLVYDITANPKQKLPKILAAAALALIVLFTAKYDLELVMKQPERLTFLVAAGFAVLLTILYRFDERISGAGFVRTLAFCGTFSYSLYLTQVVSLRLLNQIKNALHVPPSLHLVMFPIAIAFSIAVAYAFFLLFERPLLKRGKSNKPPPQPDFAAAPPRVSGRQQEAARSRKASIS